MAYVRGSATLLEAGRYADAAAMSAEAHRYATQRGLARLYGRWMSINEAEALEALGRWDEAEAVLRQACAAEATESSDVASRVALARILIRRGEAEADGLLDGLRRVADTLLHEPQTCVPLLCCLALSEHAHGRPRQCLTMLAEHVPGRFDAGNLRYWAWDVLPIAAAAMACLDDRDDDAWYDSLRSCAGTATSPRKRVAQAVADAELAGLRGTARTARLACGDRHRKTRYRPTSVRTPCCGVPQPAWKAQPSTATGSSATRSPRGWRRRVGSASRWAQRPCSPS